MVYSDLTSVLRVQTAFCPETHRNWIREAKVAHHTGKLAMVMAEQDRLLTRMSKEQQRENFQQSCMGV